MKRWAIIILLVSILGCSSHPDSLSSDESGPVLTATVVSYNSGVEWDHFDDGSFDVRDQLQLAIAPSDDPLSVSLSPSDLPTDSPFRIAGTRFTFQLDQPLSADTPLFWEALNSPAVLE